MAANNSHASTRVRVLSLTIDMISYSEVIDTIIAWAREKKPAYICFANVHMVIEAHRDKYFADHVNRASLVVSDGVPIVKFIESLYKVKQERIAGMDVLPDLVKSAEKNNLRVFFFGTTPELLERIKEKTMLRFPNIKIAGLLSPPFDRSLDDDTYIQAINNSEADLVFVALGCPKQEKWMATHFHKLNAVLLGVGGAFPVYAGIAKRAPLFMRNYGLEWMYRLCQEPKRLFKRYLITNSLFIYHVVKIKARAVIHRMLSKR